MTTSKAGHSRANSLARDITKRRNKPYKTERSWVKAKKKKLNIQTSYAASKAPHGFQFLPVGTPDLADRCKELSRQRSLPINVVNAQPVSKNAHDPKKVSHHIHRIGYHFHADVVKEACQELGYVPDNGHFIKHSALKQQNEQSRMAKTMSKHGLQFNQPVQQETDEQIRAAIRELYPRIPEEDMKQVIQHAFKKGSRRVGTNALIGLPRRVQLATTARIRHSYTDYDRLLRAFEWKEARLMVEPECLKKLIEWRGENDADNDDELEEIIRETIIIDDDDDDDDDYDDDDDHDENTVSNEDSGDSSDGSLEISHRPAADADFVVSSHNDSPRRYSLRDPLATQRINYQRNLDVSQKIGIARQQLRNDRTLALNRDMLPGNSARYPIEVGPSSPRNQDLRRESPGARINSAHPRPQFPQISLQGGAYGQRFEPVNYHGSPPAPSSHHKSTDGHALHDRPIVSIEQGTMSTALPNRRAHFPAYSSRPVTPSRQHYEKRRRMDQHTRLQPELVTPRPVFAAPTDLNQYRSVERLLRREKNDITGQGSPFQNRHADTIETSNRGFARAEYGAESTLNGHPPLLRTAPHYLDGPDPRPVPVGPVPYGSLEPLAQLNVRDNRYAERNLRYMGDYGGEPNDAYVTPFQSVPPAHRDPGQHAGSSQAPPLQYDMRVAQPIPNFPQRQMIYMEHPPLQHTGGPVHGAPAPVQQIPRAANVLDQPQYVYRYDPNTTGPSNATAPSKYPSQPQNYSPR